MVTKDDEYTMSLSKLKELCETKVHFLKTQVNQKSG